MFQSSRRPDGEITIEHKPWGFVLNDKLGVLQFIDQDIKKDCIIPSKSFAEVIVAEWPEQKASDFLGLKKDRPASQIAKIALLAVPEKRAEIIDQLMRFNDSDTLGYWQKYPQNLYRLQQEKWKPLWEWCAKIFGVPPAMELGLAKLAMPETTKSLIRKYLEEMNDYALASMQFICPISGSMLLALAQHSDEISDQQAYELANLEALFQQEHWGKDEELSARLQRQKEAFVLAGLGFTA